MLVEVALCSVEVTSLDLAAIPHSSLWGHERLYVFFHTCHVLSTFIVFTQHRDSFNNGCDLLLRHDEV